MNINCSVPNLHDKQVANNAAEMGQNAGNPYLLPFEGELDERRGALEGEVVVVGGVVVADVAN